MLHFLATLIRCWMFKLRSSGDDAYEIRFSLFSVVVICNTVIMRNSRISRISRVSELPHGGGHGGGKFVSVAEPQPPTKQIGVRSPRCLGPSSPFSYLKDPDYMNILPLDAKSGKFCTMPVQNSTYNKKRRTLDATMEEISRDLEHITFIFQEITPQAPIRIEKDEKDLPKETRLQLLESILEWLKAASFDLSWVKTAIEDKDLENANEAVQAQLYESIKSIDKLRAIHSKLMLKFNSYFRSTRNRAALAAAEQQLDSAGEQTVDLLRASKTDSGLNYRSLSNDVVELLQKERTRTAETYEAKLNSLNTTLASQAGLIKKLTDNLKGKGLYDAPKERDSKGEAEIETQLSKKTTKHKKKPHDDGEERSSSYKGANEDSSKEPKNKEFLSMQKTLQTCQLDSARLLQQNKTLIETKKELTTANAHKDKVIGELRAKLLTSELADKPKLDKLVVAAPKETRGSPSQDKPERSASPQSRFIYLDSPERGGPSTSAGPSSPDSRKGASKWYTYDDDDTQESGEAGKSKRSGDVRDPEMLDKGEKAKKSSSGEKVRIEDREGVGDVSKDAGKTHVADKTEKQTGARDPEKMAADKSVVTGAGGKVAPGLDVQGMVEGKGKDKSVASGVGGRVTPGLDVQGTVEGKGKDQSVASSVGGRVTLGLDVQGTADGKGKDRRGKAGGASEAASVGGVDVVAAREKVGLSGLGHELKGAEDRGAVGKARESPKSRGSSGSGQEAREGADSAVGQRTRRLLSAGGSSGRKSSEEPLDDQSGDTIIRLDKDAQRSHRVGGKVSLTDSSAQGRFSPGMVGQDPADMMMGGIRGQPAAGAEKESEWQRMGSASSRERGPGGIAGSQFSERDGVGRGGLSNLAFGVSKYSQDRSQARDRDPHAHFRYGTPDQDFGGGVDGFEGKSPVFGAVGWKGMPEGKSPAFGAVGWKGMPEGKSPVFGADSKGMPEGKSPMFGADSWKGMPNMGADVGYLPTGRPGSAGQQTSGFKDNLSAFMPQHMGQRLACLTNEEPLTGLRVIGATVVHTEKPDTEKGLTGAFPQIQPLRDSVWMARVLRSYAINLNDPSTFTQQLEFIKHSGTVDGLREAMKLLAPHLKLLGENEQQGENVLLDVMRTLQRRLAELIAEEFQPAIGVGTTEAKQRKFVTFVTDRRQDICSARARQRSLLSQGQARGLVHLKPLLGHEANALSPCPPYLPSGHMEALPQKIMRDTFPSQKAQRQQQTTSARSTKLRPGNQYMVGLTIGNLLKNIDKLAKCGQAASG